MQGHTSQINLSNPCIEAQSFSVLRYNQWVHFSAAWFIIIDQVVIVILLAFVT